MAGKAKKPTLNALQRWETEGGATEDEPQTPKRRRPHQADQLSKSIVDIATGEIDEREHTPEEQGKDPCAVSFGNRGDLKGGKARAAMTPARRAQIATAAKARWNKR
jgi:hypothetical protein